MVKHAALFTLISLALTCPVIAKTHHTHHAHHYAAGQSHRSRHYAEGKSRHGRRDAARQSRHDHQYAERRPDHAEHNAERKSHDAHDVSAHASHSGITCEMVRAYVAKVGLSQAIAMAKSAGISAVDEQRARQCLANKI